MVFSKLCRFVLFSAHLLTANADTIRGIEQRMLEPVDPGFCVNECSCSSGVTPVSSFHYPAGLPPPPEIFVGFIGRLIGEISRYETPIQIWLTHRIDETCWNCIAHYHPTALNVITKEDPVPRAPEEYHTSEARALCMTYALNKIMPEIFPSAVESFSA